MRAVSLSKAKDKVLEYRASGQESRITRDGLTLVVQVKIQGAWHSCWTVLETP